MKKTSIPRRFCSFCGTELAPGETYWHVNGSHICALCLPYFARQEYEPHQCVRGEEEHYDAD